MVVKIIAATQENSWYSEAIGHPFNVFDIPGTLFYYADPYLPILKNDAVIISTTPEDFIE